MNFFFFLVNDLIEDEIKSGIPSERIVSEQEFCSFKLISSFRSSVAFHSELEMKFYSVFDCVFFRGGGAALHTGDIF